MCTNGFSNWLGSLGPNSAIATGFLLIFIGREVEYATTTLFKTQRERPKSIEVQREAVEDFDQYLEASRRFPPFLLALIGGIFRLIPPRYMLVLRGPSNASRQKSDCSTPNVNRGIKLARKKVVSLR